MREALSKAPEQWLARRDATPGGSNSCRFLPGWTLLELMAVIAIVSATLAFAFPAINALMQTSGRRSAIDQVMAMLDRTRMCAIAQGRPASLVFADDRGSASERRFRAMAIFQDDPDPANPPAMITPWRVLPTGISFAPTTPSVFSASAETFPDGVTAVTFPVPNEGSLALPHLKFSPTGSVLFPNSAALAGIVLVAGYFAPTLSGTAACSDRIDVSPATGWPKFLSGSSAATAP